MNQIPTQQTPGQQAPSQQASGQQTQQTMLFGQPVNFAAKTHEGARNKANEDSYACFFVPGRRDGEPLPVWLVADGVTSASAGAQASDIAARQIKEYLLNNSGAPLSARLEQAVRKANQEIVSMAADNPDWSGMSTTLVVAGIEEGNLYVQHLGDSRAYLQREAKLYQLTVDHSWVQSAIDSGRITKEQALSHPNRHTIQRFMGANRGVEVDKQMIRLGQEEEVGDDRQMVDHLPLRDGDRVLLCSDGLYNRIPGEEMLAVLQENIERPQQGLEQLFGLALKREEPDNITAVLMYTGEDKGPSAAAAGLRGRSKWAGILVVALVAIVLGFWFLLPKQGGEADLVAQTTTATDTEAEAAAGSAAQDTAAACRGRCGRGGDGHARAGANRRAGRVSSGDPGRRRAGGH